MLNTNDEIWILEHEPLFTQGLAGKPENILVDTKIPMIKSDRGGQITYHGPGQIIFYLLFQGIHEPSVSLLVQRNRRFMNTLF